MKRRRAPSPIICSEANCQREPLWRGLCREHAQLLLDAAKAMSQ